MIKIFILLALSFFLACDGSSNKISGGGSTGTEAGNAITARVVGLDSLPAVSARVRLMSSDAILGVDASLISRETNTDKNGTFSFTDLPEGKYTVEINGNNGASQFSVVLSGERGVVDRGLDTLRQFGHIRGLFDSLSAGGVVVAQGLNHSALIAQDGTYSLDSLPSGPFSLVLVPKESSDLLYTYLNVPEGTEITTQADVFVSENTGLLFENFEDGDSQHRYGPYVGGGWWFISGDADVVITYDPAGSPSFPVVSEENGNKALHFYLDVSATASLPWVTCGMQIGENDGAYDLSAADSIIFRAKGSGSFFLELLGSETDSLVATGKTEVMPQVVLSLNSDWTRYSVPIKSMGGTEKQLKNVRLLAWVFTQSAELWLDDVKIIGISRDDLWK